MVSAHNCPPGRPLIEYYAVFVDFDSISVLVKREDSVTTFPRIQSGEIPHRGQHMCDCFGTQLERLIGTKYSLVFLYSTINETFQRHLPPFNVALFACEEPVDPATDHLVRPACSEYVWVPINQYYEKDDTIFPNLTGGDHWAWSIAENSFRGEISEKNVRPWETSAWLWKTKKRNNEVLKDLGYTITGAYEQHQISSSSAVIRIHTNSGRVYLKASHKREGLTMRCVAGFAPFLVPKPLHVDVEEEMMIMNDYGPTLADRFSAQDYKKLLMLHGKLQVASLGHIQELRDIGIPYMDFNSVYAKARKLLEDPDVDKALQKINGTTVDLEHYHNALYDLLHKLYVDLGLPITLVHGDLYDENIIKTGQKDMEYVLYDWGSARIDIPFTDIIGLEYEVCQEERNGLGMEAYLQLWASHGSVDCLKRICAGVGAKDAVLRFTKRYNYAKEKRLDTVLIDEDVKKLWNTLSYILENPL